MQVSKRGNSLAVRLLKSLVEDLELKPGDKLDVVFAASERIAAVKDDRRAAAVERMRKRAWSVSENGAFHRNEANAR